MKMTIRRPRANRTEHLVAETSDRVPNAPPARDTTALAGTPLFEGCSRQDVDRALADFDEVRFPSGRRIVLEGLRGSDFFIVVVGAATVIADGRRVATLGPGDFFGEIAVLGDGVRSASVRADTPLHCLVLPNGKLERLILDHPRLGINLIHAVIGRFRAAAVHQPPPGEAVSA